MKLIRHRITLLLLVAGLLCLPSSSSAGNETVKPGDVNNDGIVNLTDFGLLLQQLLGFNNLSGASLTGADTNTDGAIDVADLIIATQNKEFLNLSMETDADIVAASQVVMITLTGTNLSTGTLTDVRFNFLMPTGADYGSINPGETYIVNAGTLEIGESTSLNFPMTIRGNVAQDALITPQAYLTTAEGYRADVRRTLRVDNARELRLGIRADRTVAVPGAPLRYTMHYGNQGNFDVIDGVLTLPVPYGLHSAMAEDGGTITAGLATWDLGSIPAGQSGQVSLSAVVDDLEVGELIQAVAEFNDGSTSVFASVSTPVRESLPLVFEFNTSADPVRSGQTFNVQMTVSNRGTEVLNGVSASLIIPQYCDYGSFNAGEIFNMNFGALMPGQQGTVSIPLSVRTSTSAPPSGAMLYLNAYAASDEGYLVFLDRDISVDNSPVLNLGLSANLNPAETGKPLRYTLNYGNLGNFDLDNTVLEFRIPKDLRDTVVDKGGVITEGIATWDLGTLVAGTGGQVHVTGQVAPDLAEGSVIQAESTLETGDEFAYSSLATPVRNDLPLVFDFHFGADPVRAGQYVNVHQTVTNRGNQTLTDVKMNLIIPEYADDAPYNPGETRTVNVGNLLAGQSFTQTFALVIRSGANAPSDGQVLQTNGWATTAEGYRSDVTRTLKVENAPTLDVGIETDINPAFAGEPLRYTLHYGNTGLFNLDATTLTMELPSELLEIEPEDGGVVVGNTVVWNLGMLVAGASGQVHLNGTVDAGLGVNELLRAQAVLESGNQNARASITTVIEDFQPLQFDIYTSADPVYNGQIVQFTMTATNTGSQVLNGVSMNFLMSEYADFAPYNPGEVLTYSVGNLAGGQSVTENFPVTIRANASAPPQGEILQFHAWADSTQGYRTDVDRVVSVDNSPTLDVGIQTRSNPAISGQPLDYTLHYGNFGLTDVTTATLVMELPTGLTNPLPEQDGVVDGRFVTWNLGMLPSGARGQVRLTAEVDSGLATGNLLRSRAILTGGAESARSALSTIVRSTPTPLQFDVTLDDVPANSAEDVIVSISAANTGAQVLNNVTIQVLMPDYADSSSFNPGEYRTINLGDLASGQAVADHFPLRTRTSTIAPPNGELLHMKAKVTSTQGSQAVLSRNLTIDRTPTLGLGLSTDVNPAVPGEPLVYALHYGNSGAEAISGATLRLRLPVGVESPVLSGGGVMEGDQAVWQLGELAPGATGVLLTTTTVGSIASGNLLHAEADLTSAGGEDAHSMITTAVRSNSPLIYTVAVDDDATTIGGVFNVTLTVTNTGAQVLNDVVLRLIGPEYADSGSLNPGELLTSNQGTLNPSESKSLSFPFTVRSAVSTRPTAGTVIHISTWATSSQGFRADMVRDVNIIP